MAKILVVDDEQQMRKGLVNLLRREGHAVAEAREAQGEGGVGACWTMRRRRSASAGLPKRAR